MVRPTEKVHGRYCDQHTGVVCGFVSPELSDKSVKTEYLITVWLSLLRCIRACPEPHEGAQFESVPLGYDYKLNITDRLTNRSIII